MSPRIASEWLHRHEDEPDERERRPRHKKKRCVSCKCTLRHKYGKNNSRCVACSLRERKAYIVVDEWRNRGERVAPGRDW